MLVDTDSRRIGNGMEQWTFEKTFRLVGTSYLWLVGVTAPAAAILAWFVISVGAGDFVDGLFSGMWFFMIFVVVFAIIAVGGAGVSLPLTHVLGRALQSQRRRTTHVVAHTVLAGALAAACMQVLLLMFEEDTLSWQYPLLLSVPTGAAAAIATWRFSKAAPTAVPESPKVDVADEPAV
jgi:hypothetical protein